jgi:hypothetical protein
MLDVNGPFKGLGERAILIKAINELQKLKEVYQINSNFCVT